MYLLSLLTSFYLLQNYGKFLLETVYQLQVVIPKLQFFNIYAILKKFHISQTPNKIHKLKEKIFSKMILEKRVPNKISLRFLKNVFNLEFLVEEKL